MVTIPPENIALHTRRLPERLNSPICLGDVERAIEEESADIPRADGGRDAWLFLAACCVFEALIWGFPFSFGVFQTYYTTHLPFSDMNEKRVAIIGTCSTGVMYLFAPFSLYALEMWPWSRRLSSILGLVLVAAALVASSFATQIWHLIITQGVLYAIGGSLLYSPTLFYLDEWFIKKKGLAFGIMWAGVGTSGLIFPFLLTALLDKYGFRTTMRIWAIALTAMCSPLIYFIKARLPRRVSPLPLQATSLAFLWYPTFIALQLSNILESVGFFLPSIYLTTYATSIGLSKTAGTILLALLNLFSVIGAISLGYLTDHLEVTTVIAISSAGASISVFVFWGLSTSLPLLIVFACTYGVFAGGFSAIWTGMMKSVQREGLARGEKADMSVLMGLFSAGRGIGAVISGPLRGVLLGEEAWTAKFGYGTDYGLLIVVVGASALCGLICFGARETL